MADIKIGSTWHAVILQCGSCQTRDFKILGDMADSILIGCTGCKLDTWVPVDYLLKNFRIIKDDKPVDSVVIKCSCEPISLGCRCGAFAIEYKAKYGKDPA